MNEYRIYIHSNLQRLKAIGMLLLVFVLLLSVVSSLQETIKLPSSKRLTKCLFKGGFHHFITENSFFIETYADQEIYPSSLRIIVETHLKHYLYSIRHSELTMRMVTTDDIMKCTLQDVPENDLERIQRMIKEGTC